jgi:hypothetical protein
VREAVTGTSINCNVKRNQLTTISAMIARREKTLKLPGQGAQMLIEQQLFFVDPAQRLGIGYTTGGMTLVVPRSHRCRGLLAVAWIFVAIDVGLDI